MIFHRSILAAVALALSSSSSVAVVVAFTSSSSSSSSSSSAAAAAVLRSTVADETSSSSSSSSSSPATITTAATSASASSPRSTSSSRSNDGGGGGDRDILVRSARGERTERTPVWLMRQAGRYMGAFREYSDAIPFRERSETPGIAVELSLQCHRSYGMDGIIMFSDILTPLPALGIDFDVVRGFGPVISTEVRTVEDVARLGNPDEVDFDAKLPFIREILGALSREAEMANTSLIGFVGAPFTLASYTIEGKSSKHCLDTKKMMMADDGAMDLLLDKLSAMIGDYACHQIECGAQVVQVFESWAHQLSPSQFERFAKPAAQRVVRAIKDRHPDVPVIYFANGGSSYLELQRDMGADMIAVDWSVDMATARAILGPDVPISGNIDPTVLFGTKEQVEQAVRDCIDGAGGPGNRHLLNLGHGVMQGTPEEAVGWLVDECKRYRGKGGEE